MMKRKILTGRSGKKAPKYWGADPDRNFPPGYWEEEALKGKQLREAKRLEDEESQAKQTRHPEPVRAPVKARVERRTPLVDGDEASDGDSAWWPYILAAVVCAIGLMMALGPAFGMIAGIMGPLALLWLWGEGKTEEEKRKTADNPVFVLLMSVVMVSLFAMIVIPFLGMK